MARRTNADRSEERAFRRAESVLRKHWRKILRRKGVTHVDVNYRTRNGKRTDDVVIRVYVQRKVPLDELHPRQVMDKIEGVPIDIVEALNTYDSTATEIQGGARIAPVIDGAVSSSGTFGITCFDKQTKQRRGLTNAHVVLNGQPKSQLPSKIPMVLTSSGKTIGMGLRSKSFRNSLVDCALLAPVSDVTFLKGVPGLISPPVKSRAVTRRDVRRRVKIRKLGATTGETTGILDSITLTFSAEGVSFLFQIGIRLANGGKGFSKGGDSGSVVCVGNRVVGLLHGLTDDGKIAVACHIKDVKRKLAITF